MSAVEPLLISQTAARQMIGVCRTKFWKLRKEGAFEVRQIGTKSLITLKSLKAFVERLPGTPPQT